MPQFFLVLVEINQNILDEGYNRELIPYVAMHETAKVEQVLGIFEGIEITREWRYYYNYSDALAIIDLTYTKGVYDDWILLIDVKDKDQVNSIIPKYPEIFKRFDVVEEQFLRGLKQEDLIKALASKHMKGVQLELAREILKEQGISFEDEEINELKVQLIEKNLERRKKSKWLEMVILFFLVIIFLLAIIAIMTLS